MCYVHAIVLVIKRNICYNRDEHEHIMINECRQSQSILYSVIVFIKKVQNRPIYNDQKRLAINSGCWGWGTVDGEMDGHGNGFPFGEMKKV